MSEPSSLDTPELVKQVRKYSERYAGNRHRGQLFRRYAHLVVELLDRHDREGMHTEYAPVLPGGMVLDSYATAEPPKNLHRLTVASREVTEWRHHDGDVV